MRRPVCLLILDGWGMRAAPEANAVAHARTPHFDALWKENPHTRLSACGRDVGLPEGQIGNSEVGHITIGAGRTVWMDLPRIDNAIQDGSLARNGALARFIDAMKRSGGSVHLMGLVSRGGVHAHSRHIAALARLLAQAGLPVALHAFLDGRDVAPRSAIEEVGLLMADLSGMPQIRLATLSGRYFAMDRDRRWERVARAWDALALGRGGRFENWRAAIEAARERGETDEFVTPVILGDYAGMKDGDGLLMANFRSDRVRQLLAALLDPAFRGFARPSSARFAAALGMAAYSGSLAPFMTSLFAPQPVSHSLGAWLALKGVTQFRLAETEKYPHVTFFFNGGAEAPFKGETRHMVPSPKVATYDLKPAMAAGEVTDHLVGAIRSGRHGFILCNYANPDMVGHTGDLEAAIEAVEAVDEALGRVAEAVREAACPMLVIADHGNCEMMVDPETGAPHTAHTLNPVPAILFDPAGDGTAALAEGGTLANVAPTVLALMGVDPPPGMTAASLLRKAGGGG